jgi:FKBP-type peptidyl-prolyl cis-trans isomerase
MKRIALSTLAILFSFSVISTTACAEQGGAVTELIKTDVKVGTGVEAKAGQYVSVHYTGWLYDAAFNFPLGAGRVIQGWDQGVQGMKVGGQRTLVIPANLGYGARGAGGVIPPNATLLFDVELLGVN